MCVAIAISLLSTSTTPSVPVCALRSRGAIKNRKKGSPRSSARPRDLIKKLGTKGLLEIGAIGSSYLVRYLKNNVIIVDGTRVRIGNNPILCGLVARMQILSKS